MVPRAVFFTLVWICQNNAKSIPPVEIPFGNMTQERLQLSLCVFGKLILPLVNVIICYLIVRETKIYWILSDSQFAKNNYSEDDLESVNM